jgi:hypothetical protein
MNLNLAKGLIELAHKKKFNMAEHFTVKGTIMQGHQVASGQSENSPFPLGTIEMQLPFFRERGILLEDIYPATLNVDITPNSFKIFAPAITLENIKWSLEHDPETFSLSPCILCVNEQKYPAYIYYPHPETKIGHFKNDNILEILSKYIPNIPYGTFVELKLSSDEVSILK